MKGFKLPETHVLEAESLQTLPRPGLSAVQMAAPEMLLPGAAAVAQSASAPSGGNLVAFGATQTSSAGGTLTVLADGTLMVGGRFDSFGIHFSHETEAGQAIDDFTIAPSVAFGADTFVALSGGGFALIVEQNAGTGNDEIFSRIYDANGKHLTRQFHDNGPTDGFQSEIFATATSDGGYYVEYTDTSASLNDINPLIHTENIDVGVKRGDDVRGRFLTADGHALADTLVSGAQKFAPGSDPSNYNAAAGEQRSGGVAMLSNGSVIVTYLDVDYYTFIDNANGGAHSLSSLNAVSMRIMSPDGAVSGPINVDGLSLPPDNVEIQAYTGARPMVTALADGNFAVVFTIQDLSGATAELDTYVRFFDATGTALGSAVRLVHQAQEFADANVQLAGLPDGGFAMAYRQFNGSHLDVKLAVIDSTGHIASNTLVAHGSGNEDIQSLAAGPDGAIYISWFDESAETSFVQRYLVHAQGEFIRTGTDGADTIASTAKAGQESWIDAGSGDDTLTGGKGGNHLFGGEGNDIIDGGKGANIMDGGNGDDTYFVIHNTDIVREIAGGGNDTVLTASSFALGDNIETLACADAHGTAALTLTGNSIANTISGNDGANRIDGGLGRDTLTGNGGHDKFVFDTTLGAANIDKIADFHDHTSAVANTDLILLDHNIFLALDPGHLKASEFAIGTEATRLNQHIIYNPKTGALFYDADGNGSGAAIHFATLENHPAHLSEVDFAVI